ncbi:MAG: helix-turn-helix domain-containing protein [Deltaproteobacteria bacterium]|nr:helix-turn-helix domain-containing protein [Deltaproteobacteria bacterium]
MKNKIKIKSNIKALMRNAGISDAELSTQTKLPRVVISNASCEKIEFCGLNVLKKVASALNVGIKDLFEENRPEAKKPRVCKMNADQTNISAVTEKLISAIMKMSATDKDKLLEKYNELEKTPGKYTTAASVTSDLISLIMGMSLDDRCKLLGDFMAFSGKTKRKYSRMEYIKEMRLTFKGRMHNCNTRNLSHGGLFIEVGNAKNTFSLGDVVQMNFEHPQTERYCKMDGTVMRVAKNGIGIKFNSPL